MNPKNLKWKLKNYHNSGCTRRGILSKTCSFYPTKARKKIFFLNLMFSTLIIIIVCAVLSKHGPTFSGFKNHCSCKYLQNLSTNGCLTKVKDCPVGWGCRIHRLHLCRGVGPPPQWVSCNDTKQSDSKVSVMLGLSVMRSTPSLPLLPGPLWPGVIVPDRALSTG